MMIMGKLVLTSLAVLILILVLRYFPRPSSPVDGMSAAPILYGNEILPIQKAIAEADLPNTFYATTYSREEPFYWTRILTWMHEDKRRVNRILDIGCGYGTLLAHASQLYGAHGYCMDVTDYLKGPIQSRYDLRFSKSNIELDAIPWSDKFDVVIFTEVLEHLNFRPVPTLRKIHDALAPGGRLYLSTPDQSSWGKTTKHYARLADLPMPVKGKSIVDDHIWIFSTEELTAALEAAAFTIERLEYSAEPRGLTHFNLIALRD